MAFKESVTANFMNVKLSQCQEFVDMTAFGDQFETVYPGVYRFPIPAELKVGTVVKVNPDGTALVRLSDRVTSGPFAAGCRAVTSDDFDLEVR